MPKRLPPDFNYDEFKKQTVMEMNTGKTISDLEDILKPLISDVIQASLQGELDSHLNSENNNRRNGSIPKSVRMKSGTYDIKTPRDRNSTFEPILVPKRKTIFNESLDDKILSLYARGMSYGDIAEHMDELYGMEISKATLSAITDKVIPVIREWQERQLEDVYAFVWMDAFVIKVKEEGFIRKKSAYCVLGVSSEGQKEVLGIYLGETEGAKFWLQVLTDLKNRGVKDILIASIDGLKGFPDAIQSVFPKTEVQLCIVHQIRNSLKYVSWKDYRPFLRDLKQVYRASSKDLAEKRLGDLEERWGAKYPIVMKSWHNNWDNLTAYFKYPEEIRKVFYTTNIIEGFHRQIRKVINSKGAFVNKDAFLKIAYLAIQNITKKWNRPIHNWNRVHAQLCILFEDRIPLSLTL
jgi:putative transposase